MTDPLTDIENKKGQTDIGVTAYRLFDGARSDGATFWEAVAITFAWFQAMTYPPKQDDN